MRRAKEWEATLPRSSKFNFLAAALRSSQAPRPVPPNCNAAEQAQEGRSGVPCQNQEDLRPDLNQIILQQVDNPEQQQLVQQQQWQLGAIAQPQPQQRNKQQTSSNPRDKKKPSGGCDNKFDEMKRSIPSLNQVRKAYEQLGNHNFIICC